MTFLVFEIVTKYGLDGTHGCDTHRGDFCKLPAICELADAFA